MYTTTPPVRRGPFGLAIAKVVSAPRGDKYIVAPIHPEHEGAEPVEPVDSGAVLSEAGASRVARVPVTLFEVPFAAAMDGHDLAILAGALDMSTTLRSKGDTRENDLSFARLDHFSGLFLKRSSVQGEWVLKAMTWGHPGPQAVHGWHVAAAAAAHRLDPTVKAPDRMADTAPDIPTCHVGRASNRRLSRFRRRLVGVS